MTTYLIKAFTDVYEDHYTEGEREHVNCYPTKAEVEAGSPKEAVLNFLVNELYFTNGYFDEETKCYCNTVDNDNAEISEKDTDILEKFKKQEVVLFSSYTCFKIFELKEQTIN